MKFCPGCGKLLSARATRQDRGHRERDYCKNACRQRAYRKRLKQKQAIDQHPQSVDLALKMLDMQRETAEAALTLLERAQADISYHETIEKALRLEIALLNDQLAEKEAEIVRLTILLEYQAKRKRP